ncbi:MAG: TatD family nuclease-associated radical SAM protein [Clostridiales bacterium]|nr:TatD family nuclease-associated radical SAM protein [Clostridiales bacterium]
MANTYVYTLDGKAYINLTNKCHNACSFCIRNTGDGVKDAKLWLDREPNGASEVMAELCKLANISKEGVFCGFGEPTECFETLKAVARELKAAGYKTRLNTNGLGSLANGRNIAPELKGLIDVVSVSLNNHNAEKYLKITNSEYGLRAFPAVIEFATACKAQGIETVFTVVDVIGANDVAECRALCDGIGIPLRVREYVADNYKTDQGD